jgi:hypothetical protein
MPIHAEGYSDDHATVVQFRRGTVVCSGGLTKGKQMPKDRFHFDGRDRTQQILDFDNYIAVGDNITAIPRSTERKCVCGRVLQIKGQKIGRREFVIEIENTDSRTEASFGCQRIYLSSAWNAAMPSFLFLLFYFPRTLKRRWAGPLPIQRGVFKKGPTLCSANSGRGAQRAGNDRPLGSRPARDPPERTRRRSSCDRPPDAGSSSRDC